MTGTKDRPRAADPPEVLARVQEGLPLVDQLARQMRRNFGNALEVDELASHGHEALLGAARSFDPERRIPFRSWAVFRIRGAMIDSARQRGNLPKRVYRKLRALQAADAVHDAANEELAAHSPANAEAADARLSDQLGTAAMAMALGFLRQRDDNGPIVDPEPSPESNVGQAELVTRVRAAMSELPEQERRLLESHYFGEATLEEAAAQLGLSKSWGSRLHYRAIESLSRAMKRSGTGG